jgi:hypothetical protein
MGLLRSCFARTQTCLQAGKQTKGQLAIDILGDADADGLTFDFVCEVRRLLAAALETFNGGGDRLVW